MAVKSIKRWYLSKTIILAVVQAIAGILVAVISEQPEKITHRVCDLLEYVKTRSIYNIDGRLLETLVNGETQQEGNHSVLWNTGEMCSGIYFYRCRAADNVVMGKMVLLK